MIRIGIVLSKKGGALKPIKASCFYGLGAWFGNGNQIQSWIHIDDLVENISMVSPNGRMNSLRVPGSGAGPSPDRFMLGSEGSMGIITDAWVKLQKKPKFKATAGYLYSDFLSAAQAVKSISQAGLYPANVRIVDDVELKINSASKRSYTLMIVSFENADHNIDPWISRAEECCLDPVSYTHLTLPTKRIV